MKKFSIIIPSYNQAGYLAQAISSVIDQSYPQIEIIVMDGSSADHSVDVIKQFKNHISYWESKPDRGQSHAINKGFQAATGDYVGWLNSDDMLAPDSLKEVAAGLEKNHWVTGSCTLINAAGDEIETLVPEVPPTAFRWMNLLVRGYSTRLLQPSTFYRKQVFETSGFLDESMHYSFDHEFFLRLYQSYGPPLSLSQVLSYFRIHDTSKTSKQRPLFHKENRKIGWRYLKRFRGWERLYLLAQYARYGLR